MPMSPRLLRPRASSALVATDADAKTYINAVRTADGGQYMEAAVQRAIDAFIVGCKADGIWTAIKASCILMGARTLSGALTPLVGTAPTNNGPFVSGDYNRKTGLVGNGTSKALDSNRNNNADPQNNNHNAVFVSEVNQDPTALARSLIGSDGTGISGSNVILISGATSTVGTRSRCSAIAIGAAAQSSRLFATSRQSSASYSVRINGTTSTVSESSSTTEASNVFVFRRANAGSPAYALSRLAFYSIGESLDLSLLDSRVSTLYTAIGAAIP